MNLYYKRAVFYPVAVSVLLTTLFAVISNANYHNDWLKADSEVWLSVIVSVSYGFIWGIACLPIWIVKIYAVNRSKLATALCWFVLPVSVIIIFVVHESSGLLSDFPIVWNDTLTYISLLISPSVIGLVWSYISYFMVANIRTSP